jgi:ribosomal protein S16
MAVSIKLLRIGKKGAPNYRFVIIDKRKKPSSDYIESIGRCAESGFWYKYSNIDRAIYSYRCGTSGTNSERTIA